MISTTPSRAPPAATMWLVGLSVVTTAGVKVPPGIVEGVVVDPVVDPVAVVVPSVLAAAVASRTLLATNCLA